MCMNFFGPRKAAIYTLDQTTPNRLRQTQDLTQKKQTLQIKNKLSQIQTLLESYPIPSLNRIFMDVYQFFQTPQGHYLYPRSNNS